MAAVLALMVVPVILLVGLAVGSAFAEPSATSFLSAGVFVALLGGAFVGLFSWFRDLDHDDQTARG